MTIKVCMVTNIPAPYREKVHELVNKELDGYHVIYCQDREINRKWEFPFGDYPRTFLKKRVINYKGNSIHINPDVWSALNAINPDIVITCGFNPTFLMAFLWCVLKKKKHICMNDGWLKSEDKLSLFHKMIRKYVFYASDAFIGASNHSLDLYRFYNCPEEMLFKSLLCVDNEYFKRHIEEEKKYDVMFSGQFIDRKMPRFFCCVVKKIKEKKKDCSVLILGSGPQKNEFLGQLNKFGIDYYYPGFVQQNDLPNYYASAKLFLFPTLNDPWGVVANEACAAGVPVITCENAGVANDLILNGQNGFILPLKSDIWADACFKLLNNKTLYKRFSKEAMSRVQQYNFDVAATGIIDAVKYVSEKSAR